MNTSLTLSMPNRMAALPPLNDTVNGFLEQHAVAPEGVFHVNLVIEELITNIVKYGYDDSGVHTITITVAIEPETVIVATRDDGHPFNPLDVPAPDIHLPLDQRKVGGLGLHLVKKSVQAITYRREAGANCLEIRIARK